MHQTPNSKISSDTMFPAGFAAAKEQLGKEESNIHKEAETTKTPTLNPTTSQLADNCNSIDELREAVRQYEGLDIKKGATNTVFADGNPKSDIMLIGEAPGANEDIYGIPFCGQSGKLLDNILAAINIDRSKCYITNTIFWRPPANRRPTSEEIKICRPFVEKHVSLVNPKIIILVGSTAVESLLDAKTPMNLLRNQTFKYKNVYLSTPIDTFVIFHPSYLLRQPSQKKVMWLDIQKINQFYLSILHK
ncbi:uracil-DNA glycosylase [Candidatus Bandiella euplotis]|nr:uracil-DNA glycosylase [Candidatus Bandiella woodruffii]